MKQKNQAKTQVDLDFELWRLFDHTRFMIGRLREMELAEFGLTPEQSHVLDILAKSGGVTTINEIVEITQRQHHSISTLINRMARQGMVTKKKTPTDNRKYDVVITERGKKLVKQLSRESVRKVFTCLSGPQREELTATLRCLRDEAYSLHEQINNQKIKTEKSRRQAQPAD